MAGLVLLACMVSALTVALSGPSTTQWLVVEDDLIQPRKDPSFDLTRPQNLFAFLHQDSLREEIVQIYHNLMRHRSSVQELWLSLEKATDLSAFVEKETTCYGQLDLYPSVVDSIRRDEETEMWIAKLQGVEKVKDEPPDCSKFSSLPFSMFTFEHLEGMRDRSRLSMVPDVNLPLWVAPAGDPEAFGRQLSRQLRREGVSWLHYALASVYWKFKGDATEAVECGRRAVLYAPRKYKDVALLGLGNTFHRSMRHADARTLLQAAVDHAPGYGLNQLALGNALAAAGDADGALAAYGAAERLGEAHARHNLRVARCRRDLAGHAGHVETLLHQILANISEYRTIESHWWRQQATFLNSIKQYDNQFTDENLSLDTICAATESVLGLRCCEVKGAGDRHHLMQLLLGDSAPVAAGAELVRLVARQMREVDNAASYPRLRRTMDGAVKFEVDPGQGSRFSEASVDLDHNEASEGTALDDGAEPRARLDASEDGTGRKTQSEFPDFEGGTVLYPPTYKVNRHREEFDTEDEWPSKEACSEWAPKFQTHLDAVQPIFLPFENKGLVVKGVMSERIGLTLHEEHPLPWRPPVCDDLGSPGATASAPALPRLPKNAQGVAEGMPTEALRSLLLRYAGDGWPEHAKHMNDAEIGQRILTAHKKKVAPKWILYTLSSLYWRVRNNNANALTCLASANRLAPPRYRDVVQTSLASVLLEVGYVEEALSVATQAFRLSSHEPATNFLLSLIHAARNNRAAQAFHLRQALRADPEHAGGLARALLYAGACRDAATASEKEASDPEGVCMEGERPNGVRAECAEGASSGARVAEVDGCARAPLHTFRHHGYKLEEEISTIVRLLNLKPQGSDDEMEGEEASHLWERTGREQPQLQQRYRLLEKMLKNCGEEECANLYPVKAEDVQGHSCFFQHLRFWYWLPYLRLDTLLAERGIRLSDKLKLEQRSQYKFPECRAPPSRGDPALEWLQRVEPGGWRPVADLLHEVAAMLGRPGSPDEVSSLLAHHVEQNGSWLGFLAAGLWCGGFARGACCLRCFAAALHAAPPRHRDVPLLSLVAVLHLQDKVKEAKHAAYLALPLAPKSKLHLFVVGISHTYVGEYEAAIRMLRASLTQEPGYAVARACLQATMCLVLFMDDLSAGHQ